MGRVGRAWGEAFSCIAAFCRTTTYATTPRARALFGIHYEGCQVWSRLCWGYFFLGGAIHPEMGRRNGALCTLPDFPMRLSHEPGLWIYSGHQYRHVRTTLAGHIRAAARPRHARADDTTTHTPLHSPLHSAFQHQILAGLQSPNEYNPPTNKQHRQ